jgi:hypothetical protein
MPKVHLVDAGVMAWLLGLTPEKIAKDDPSVLTFCTPGVYAQRCCHWTRCDAASLMIRAVIGRRSPDRGQ